MYKKQYSGRVIVFVGDSRVMMSTSGKGHKKVRDNFYMCWVNGGNVTVLKKNSTIKWKKQAGDSITWFSSVYGS